eukprot:3868-Heterococcus_DN1.PRE.13
MSMQGTFCLARALLSETVYAQAALARAHGDAEAAGLLYTNDDELDELADQQQHAAPTDADTAAAEAHAGEAHADGSGGAAEAAVEMAVDTGDTPAVEAVKTEPQAEPEEDDLYGDLYGDLDTEKESTAAAAVTAAAAATAAAVAAAAGSSSDTAAAAAADAASSKAVQQQQQPAVAAAAAGYLQQADAVRLVMASLWRLEGPLWAPSRRHSGRAAGVDLVEEAINVLQSAV